MSSKINDIKQKIKNSNSGYDYWFNLISTSNLCYDYKQEMINYLDSIHVAKNIDSDVIHNVPNLWQNISGVNH